MSNTRQFTSRSQWIELLVDSIATTKKANEVIRIGVVGALGTYDLGDEAMLMALKGELDASRDGLEFVAFSVSPSYTRRVASVDCVPSPHLFYEPRKRLAHFIVALLDLFEEKISSWIGRLLRPGRELSVWQGGWIKRAFILWQWRRPNRLIRHPSPSRAKSRYGFWDTTAEHVSGLDALLYLGGGYINSWNIKADTFWYLLISRIASARGVPVFASSLNLGPFNRFDRRVVYNTLSSFRLVGVRDARESLEHCRRIAQGHPSFSYEVSGDDATSLPIEATDRTRAILAQNVPFLALHVHRWRLPNSMWNAFAQRIASVINQWTEQSGHHVMMLSMTTLDPADPDRRALEDIARRIQRSERIIWPPERLVPGEIKHLFVSAAESLVTRHHSLVFAGGTQRPAVAVAYDRYYEMKLTGIRDLQFPHVTVTRSSDLNESAVIAALSHYEYASGK